MKNYLLLILFIISSYSFAQLSGNYYIPQGVNPQGYASLAAAFTDLNANGCSGTVYFYIDGDLAETGANLLITRSDLTGTNKLIIKPASGKTPTITISGCTNVAGATQYAGLTLSGASYITIDGSNTVGGTTQDLTFSLNDATNGRYIINLYGNTDYNIVKNVKLIHQSALPTTNTCYTLYLNGTATGAADDFLIENCQLGNETRYAAYAMQIRGYVMLQLKQEFKK